MLCKISQLKSVYINKISIRNGNWSKNQQTNKEKKPKPQQTGMGLI